MRGNNSFSTHSSPLSSSLEEELEDDDFRLRFDFFFFDFLDFLLFLLFLLFFLSFLDFLDFFSLLEFCESSFSLSADSSIFLGGDLPHTWNLEITMSNLFRNIQHVWIINLLLAKVKFTLETHFQKLTLC